MQPNNCATLSMQYMKTTTVVWSIMVSLKQGTNKQKTTLCDYHIVKQMVLVHGHRV